MKTMNYSLVLLCVLLGCAAEAPREKGIQPQDIAGRPAVYCKVTVPPDPALVGAWQCIHPRFIPKTSETQEDAIEYVLLKSGNQYAIYFYRDKDKGERIYSGWRNWTINGNEVVSDTGVRIFTQDGKVYYSWKRDKPTQMTPLELRK